MGAGNCEARRTALAYPPPGGQPPRGIVSAFHRALGLGRHRKISKVSTLGDLFPNGAMNKCAPAPIQSHAKPKPMTKHLLTILATAALATFARAETSVKL